MNDAINSSRNEAMRGPWMTPARARGLAAAASDQYRQLREAELARDADPDLAQRRAGGRLDVAACRGLHSAAEELLVHPGAAVALRRHGRGRLIGRPQPRWTT